MFENPLALADQPTRLPEHPDSTVMAQSVEQFVEQIHGSPGRVVLALSGGGSRAIADLLEVPGASRTVLEAVVPYSESALIAWLGGRPDQFCSRETARAMAMVAFHKAREQDRSAPAGIGCTAGLATDRPKLGPHQAHVALQTASTTATWSVEFQKDARTRAEEERLVDRLILNVTAEACGLDQRLEIELLQDEPIETTRADAPTEWQELLLGKVETVGLGGPSTGAIFPGAFNPMHQGHRRIIEVARQMLGVPVALELSIQNADKPPLDYFEIDRRLGQFDPRQPVWLTRADTFEAKSRLFRGATFPVGMDTLRRIADPRFYGNSSSAMVASLERIAGRGCRLLVFGRDMGTGFMRLSDLDLPDVLRAISREVPADQFHEDISSTSIRRAEAL